MIFQHFAQNLHCGYTLEPPRQGGCNEYPQCMCLIKNKKIRYAQANPSFFLFEEALRVTCQLHWNCFSILVAILTGS